ncbi:MAG: YIP1 family protein [Oscillospiraceae bacterium]|nr:YIP1 family protein [Oscillospiraceae bacterium]
MKKICVSVLCVLLIAAFTTAASAADSAPTDTFTHWDLSGGRKTVSMRPVYEAVHSVTARSLGLKEDIGLIKDMDCDEKGNTYLLTDGGRIVRFDSEFRFLGDYEIKDEGGAAVDFSGAGGFCVYSQTEIYIADTKNARVLRCENGVVKRDISLPESALIPSDFTFKPSGVAKDGKDYLYVISEGSYYGAVLYDPDGEFAGFYGANTVKGNMLTSFSALWDRLTMNDAKRSKTKKALPYQFTDICIDEKGFVYTCTGKNVSENTGQIRMLSPGGTNILPGAESLNFGEQELVKRLNVRKEQNFGGITADGRGFIYALDKTYGLIYIYDSSSNMIAAFGGGSGLGRQTGVFSSASALALSGSRLMVADSLKSSVTVFERTDYGETLLAAQEMTLASDYINAQPLWERVREYDVQNRLALGGLAKAAAAQGNYRAAMGYAKAAGDGAAYGEALQRVQSIFISKYFVWLFLAAVLLLSGLTAFIILTKKRQIILIKNAKLRTAVAGMVHPFRSFNDIKYRQMGSLGIAAALTSLYFLTSAAATNWSDFRFTAFDASTYNSLFQIVQTVGLILLWSVANWGISTLQEGKGKLKEVYTVTAYSVLPLILFNVISTPLTHLIVSPNGSLISGLNTLSLIFTGIMLTVGLMVIHDFSFPRFLFTAVVTVLFMLLIIFVLFMAGILLTYFWNFAWNVLMEALRWQ